MHLTIDVAAYFKFWFLVVSRMNQMKFVLFTAKGNAYNQCSIHSSLLCLKAVLHWYWINMLSLYCGKQNLLFLCVDCFKSDESITKAGRMMLQLEVWFLCSWYISSFQSYHRVHDKSMLLIIERCSLQIPSATKCLGLLVAVWGILCCDPRGCIFCCWSKRR